uniref:SWIM-type domain-containing protein n=1 Tax=Vitis vinifera TaxID=29760 RepID=A5AFG7_VITVI|nr:hypothetical protein VITISV_030080 [Vitis vinifera]
MVRTQTDVDYVGDRVVVEPIDVPLGTTYEQLLEMIYLVTDINREHFQLILSCKYPMKRGNKFQPYPIKNDSGIAQMLEMHNRFGMNKVELFVEQVPIDLQMNSPIGNCIPLLLGENDGVKDVHNDDNQDRKGSSPFLAVHEAIEREQMRYVVVDGERCNLSNKPDTEDLDDPIELSPMQYHLAPSLQFENVENIGHVVSSDWTSWGNTLTGHPIEEFIVDQIFNPSPFLAVHEAIEREQMRYVVVDGERCNLSNKPDTEDLDDPIELSPMQYHLAPSLQFENVENIGHIVSRHPIEEFIVDQIFNSKGDLQHATKMYYINSPQEYIVLSSTKKLLVLRCKKAEQSQCPWRLRAKVFQQVFWAFHPSRKGFKHFRLVLTIDGTHLYGKYKGTVMIVMGCDKNNQLFPLVFALTDGENVDSWGCFLACIRNRVTQMRGLCVIFDHLPGIMVAFANVYLGWSQPNAYHRSCMCHLASNFMTRFKDKCLKQLLCRAALETKVEKFNMHMDTIGRINQDALSRLEVIPFEKWALSHDEGQQYGIMTTNMSEVFNNVLKGARSFPITAFVQLTFYRVNSYFVVRREHGASRLASGEEYTSYVDVKINANVVKAGSHEVVLYYHFQGLFHVKASRGRKNTSSDGRTYRVNLHEHGCTCGKTLIYGFPCSHILTACHFRSIDFISFVQHYTMQSYFSTWTPLFNPIHNEYEWPPYVGPVIVPADSMKHVSSG